MTKYQEVRRYFPRSPSSCADVRRFVAQSLHGCASQLDFPAAVLLADELATNAIVHATGDDFGLVIRVDPRAVRITIEDQDPTPPILTAREGATIGGLGLPIVGALADSWGVSPAAPGKQVWFELNRSTY